MPRCRKVCSTCGECHEVFTNQRTCPSCKTMTLSFDTLPNCNATNDKPGVSGCILHHCRLQASKHDTHECVCGKIWKD